MSGSGLRLVFFLLLCLAPPGVVLAQEASVDRHQDAGRRHTFGAWGSASFASPSWWGAVQEREVFLLGVRYQHTVSRSESVFLAYTFDLIPAAAVTNTPVRTTTLCCQGIPRALRRDLEVTVEQVEPSTAYGIGAVPLGFQLELFRNRPLYLTLGAGGGLLLFDRDVPRLDTRRMNFTATVNAGVGIDILDAWKMTLGYKYHHLSNAGTGTFNPGLDSSMFYLAWMHR